MAAKLRLAPAHALLRRGTGAHQRLHRRDQQRGFGRVRDVGIRARIQAAHLVVVLDIGRRQMHHRQMLRVEAGPRVPADLEAVDVGQVHVEDDGGNRGACDLQCFGAGRRFAHAEARGAQYARGRVAGRGVVVHHQHLWPARAGSTRETALSLTARDCAQRVGSGGRQLQRQHHREGRAHAELALQLRPCRPSSSARRLLSDRPRPVPRSASGCGESTCTKSWNIA